MCARALLLAALLACACTPLRTSRQPVAAPGPPAAIAVRLAQAEGVESIELATPTGPLVLRRRGALIEASDGRRGERFLVEPESRAEVLTLGRAYPGLVRVELHPRGGLRAVNEVELEAYVEGVVASEVPLWSAQPSELEALAIAARTYAQSARASGAPLWDDTRDQAYGGRFRPEQGAKGQELRAKLERAVAVTRGLVLCEPDGSLVAIRYHAACGGRTAASARSPGVECEACARRAQAERLAGRPDARRPLAWRHALGAPELARFAAALEIGSRLRSLAPVRVDAAGRWLEVEVVGDLGRRRIPFDRLRQLLGSERIKSGLILRTVPREGEPIQGELLFEGLGRGHGQGLCQEGARDYAELGWSAEHILEHYYPGARLQALPASASPFRSR